jgi:hypothetical protein
MQLPVLALELLGPWGRAYLFREAFEIVLRDLIFVFIDEWLDVGE